MNIRVIQAGKHWELQAAITGSHSDGMADLGLPPEVGFYWSTERIWAEHGFARKKFETQAAAELYLKTHRKKLEAAEVQP